MARFRSAAAASCGLGTLLASAAFIAEGGNQRGRMTAFEVVVLLGAGAVLSVLFSTSRGWTSRGLGTALLLGAFTLVTTLSVLWSIAPADTISEAGRTLTYLAVFGLAVAAGQLRPRASRAVAGGILIGCLLVCGWALLSRVFPAHLARDVLGARLGEPFDYWNALGAMAALGVPCALWLGSRRDGPPLLGALAYPAMGVLGLVVALTQSRGALAVTVCVVLAWLVLVPLRLRSLPLVVLPALVVAPVASWALSKAAFTELLEPLSTRQAVAGQFGWMALGMCVALLLAGCAVEFFYARRPPSLKLRRRAGGAVAVAICGLALSGLVSVAVSDRGVFGTVSDGVTSLTSEKVSTPEGTARLGSVSSSRAAYWHQAAQVFEERPLLGRGANTFGLARLRYRSDGRTAQHAHGFLAQALSDLGLVGVALALALALAWLAAAARSIGLGIRRRPRPEWSDERVALVAVSMSAAAFGLHSAIDWIWFVPGPSIAALGAAGFVAGRGALPGVGVRPASMPADTKEATAGRRVEPLRVIAAGSIFVIAALCAWAIWQPERADRATDRAYEALDRGDLREASEQVLRARDLDPYSPDPLFATATVLSEADRLRAAYHALEQAALEHPRDPNTWLRLAGFELRLDLPARALRTLSAAFAVDPNSARIDPLAQSARTALEAVEAPAQGQ